MLVKQATYLTWQGPSQVKCKKTYGDGKNIPYGKGHSKNDDFEFCVHTAVQAFKDGWMEVLQTQACALKKTHALQSFAPSP